MQVTRFPINIINSRMELPAHHDKCRYDIHNLSRILHALNCSLSDEAPGFVTLWRDNFPAGTSGARDTFKK